VCGSSVPFEHVRREGKERGLGVRLMAVVAEGKRGRVYVAPDDAQTIVAKSAQPPWKPDAALPHNPRDFKTPNYGMTTFADLFTDRQLVALTTFSDLVSEARQRVLHDAEEAVAAGAWPVGASFAATDPAQSSVAPRFAATGSAPAGQVPSPSPADSSPDEAGEPTATVSGYADAVATYLAFPVDRGADYWSTIATWHSGNQQVRCTFARQAIPMTWDFVEANPFSGSSGGWESLHDSTVGAMATIPASRSAVVKQLDVVAAQVPSSAYLVSTDPPYYDNIGYADLSDYFYVWLRRSVGTLYPELMSTLTVPKTQELVASSYRFPEGKRQAKEFFEDGLRQAFARIHGAADPRFPLTVYYAFKQSETHLEEHGSVSTGWQTMLESLLRAGFTVECTWPVRSELVSRILGHDANTLASSVVLACRPRRDDAPLASRREFLSALKAELPDALRHLQRGNIAPVDLAQASIGPGMGVFSRYRKVLEADGSAMSVRTALALINQALDEILAEQEGEFDADTRWALAWFEECGFEAKDFGRAETLSKAKNTSVTGMVEAGIVEARGGKVRLLRRDELDPDWDPASDRRITVWEMTQHLIRRLDGGEAAAAALARRLGANAEVARDLAYRLYLICERKKWSEEGRAYNGLVVAWPHIQELAAAAPGSATEGQTSLDL